jgi:hypothetical protein
MKKIFHLLVILLFCFTAATSQRVYFIYLQTDNQQPFYARMGERIYNSTPSGYLILSNLRDSNYTINIGLQGSQAPDQPYSITVNKRDQGFLIKNFGEKGWGLFNLSSMAITMPVSKPVGTVQTVKTEKREDNAFTNLLAKAADDSTIKEKPVMEKPAEKTVVPVITETKPDLKTEEKEITPPKQEEIKKEIIPVEKKEDPKTDTVASNNQIQKDIHAAKIKADSIAEAKKREDELIKQEELRKQEELKKQEELRRQDSINKTRVESINIAEYKRSTVKLKSESSTTAGIGLVFLDMGSDNVTDTIRILIPAETKKSAPIELKQEEKKFLDIPAVDSIQKEMTKANAVKSNNCKEVANEDDFFKLRKKMAAESSDDNMIAEAKKVFKVKCFSTLQIKNLGALFLTDESKYKFFDAAYQFVNDPDTFVSLQSELKEEYFINRFKAMLRQY